ncbi:MAG TPA: response regulator transcription factor, partial [Solirubrobacter sp.]
NRAAAVHAARRLGVLADHRAEQLVTGVPAGSGVRVLVADPDDVRRAGLLLALHGRPWITACSGARDAHDALAAVQRMAPDVALVAGLELSRAVATGGVRTLLVRDDEADSAAELREAGATGTVRQWWTSERLADAVAHACRGSREVGGSNGAPSASSPDPRAGGPGGGGAPAVVSCREHEVLAAFATGATNPAIAADLGLSPNTVKQHASSIFRKLGVRNRAEAVRRANDLGLLQT